MVHLISYDLNDHEQASAYTKIEKIIKDNAEDVRKPLYSQWFVKTTLSPNQWVQILNSALDSDDSIFVMQVQQPYPGWLSNSIHDWLNENR